MFMHAKGDCMAVSVQMPKQGNTVEECLLVEWRVKEGDAVKAGDILCAIETDKAAFEVEATADGIVLKLLAAAGDLVPVLTDIAVIGAAGESAASATPAPAAAGAPAAPAKAQEKAPAPAAAAPTPAPAAPAKAAPAGAFVPVSPRARGLAEKLGVDAAAVPGSGPGGRVLSTDVQKAVDSGAAVKASPLAKAVMAETGKRPAAATGIGGLALAADLGTPPPIEAPVAEAAPAVAPYQGIRKLIGDRMLQSLRDRAQLTLNASADASGLMSLRKIYKAANESAAFPNITINDLVCWVVARTLPLFPEINTLFDREKATLTRFTSVNLAFAVDTPRGLMVPVVTDAHRLPLSALAEAMAARAEECRKGSINPDFLAGGTFTISNLGGMGVESFTPVLNPPQVGILGVCAITQRAVPGTDGAARFRPMMGLSLTFDHQAVDGAPAAKFLKAVAKGIESVHSTLALRGAL